MSKPATFGGDLLKLIFLGETIANIAINATVSPITAIYVSLHTADPGETPASGQAQSETTYTGYARLSTSRSGTDYSVTGDVLTLLNDLVFGKCTVGTPTITHVGFGTASTGNGKLLYSGALPASMAVTVGTRPIIEAGSTITEG